jgi:VanZ family protein
MRGVAAPGGRRRAVWWIPAAALAAAIFVLSSIPGSAFPPVHVSDKLVHAAVYAPLGALVATALRRGHGLAAGARLVVVATAIAAAYGVSDEIHQMFVPFRSAELLDAVADAVGAVLGAAVHAGWSRVRSRSRR